MNSYFHVTYLAKDIDGRGLTGSTNVTVVGGGMFNKKQLINDLVGDNINGGTIDRGALVILGWQKFDCEKDYLDFIA